MATSTPFDLDSADLKLFMKSGAENNPCDPFGAVDVTITAEQVWVENRHRGSTRSWKARPRPELLTALRERLRLAGFPEEPVTPMPPPDTTMRVFRATAGETTAAVMMPEHGVPAWKGVFALFDDVARQTSSAALKVGRADAVVLVDDAVAVTATSRDVVA